MAPTNLKVAARSLTNAPANCTAAVSALFNPDFLFRDLSLGYGFGRDVVFSLRFRLWVGSRRHRLIVVAGYAQTASPTITPVTVSSMACPHHVSHHPFP
jgi:hypothetical protein